MNKLTLYQIPAKFIFISSLFVINLILFLPSTDLAPLIPKQIPYFDKMVHFTIFHHLTLFFILGFIHPKKWFRQGRYVVLFFTIYAFATEMIQTFCQRGCDFYDFFADFSGIIFAWIILRTIFHFYRLFYKKKHHSPCGDNIRQ